MEVLAQITLDSKRQDSGSADLVGALDCLDVPFLADGHTNSYVRSVTPEDLLVRLAESPEARLRLALIPLFLRHPEFDQYAYRVLANVSLTAALGFKCYFAAAVLLQRKHWERLQELAGPTSRLTPHFFGELGIVNSDAPNEELRRLAARQAALSGREINWLGTYEHAATRFLSHLERRVQWTV
jgi:hypothetical protein